MRRQCEGCATLDLARERGSRRLTGALRRSRPACQRPARHPTPIDKTCSLQSTPPGFETLSDASRNTSDIRMQSHDCQRSGGWRQPQFLSESVKNFQLNRFRAWTNCSRAGTSSESSSSCAFAGIPAEFGLHGQLAGRHGLSRHGCALDVSWEEDARSPCRRRLSHRQVQQCSANSTGP